jgi:hypothetical protein
LFIAAGGNCVGALLGGVIAARFGITAPYWAGFVMAALVSAGTWRVFNRAAVAEAYRDASGPYSERSTPITIRSAQPSGYSSASRRTPSRRKPQAR